MRLTLRPVVRIIIQIPQKHPVILLPVGELCFHDGMITLLVDGCLAFSSVELDGMTVVWMKDGRAVASNMFRRSRDNLELTKWSQMTAALLCIVNIDFRIRRN